MSETASPKCGLITTMKACLDLEKPKSFFLQAGAGSGKTRALITAMSILEKRYGKVLRQSGRRIAVITYTNAACDEIRRRIDFDPIFAVSTIHSFAWDQIRTHHTDISTWLRGHLSAEIAKLREKQARGRLKTKAANSRQVKIRLQQNRKQNLDAIKQFTYSPNGVNIGTNSLNHAEVIEIAAWLIMEKPLMRQILIRKYPALLIDEIQDTQKDLVDAFFCLQAEHPNQFCLGLFGDTMQRIYADGKVELEIAVPDNWERPAISTNHRCPKRIVSLLNQIRSHADDDEQEPRHNAKEGVVRLFLVRDTGDVHKRTAEEEAARAMAGVTSDDAWLNQQGVKTLILEHQMAAHRGGFARFFEPLYRISKFKTGVLDGTLPGLAFLAQRVLPLVKSLQSGDRFAVARIVLEHSTIVSPDILSESMNALEEIRRAKRSVDSVYSLWIDKRDPPLLDILNVIRQERLFEIPDEFAPILSDADGQENDVESDTAKAEQDSKSEDDAWREALEAPFSQFEKYVEYRSDKSPFGTHQGIKGLEFCRVMAILDDKEAKGFMFSYDKLLEAKPLTKTDEMNKQQGKDSSVDRTRRLFYVICSRAKRSLAVVVYTKEVEKVADFISRAGWFEDHEVIQM